MRKAFLLVALAVTSLAGCATNQKFQAKMDGFVGKPESAVVMAYGPPQSTYQLQDGSKVIRYERSSTVALPGYTTHSAVTTNTYGSVNAYGPNGSAYGNYSGTSTSYVPQTTAPTVITASCKVNFSISPSGIITAWSSEGNACRSD